MSQKHIQLYDDSVLKLSIKQGEEADRFPAKVPSIDTIDYDVTSTLPGAFTMGELAFTRDTGRVFVGNFTSEDEFLYDSTDKTKVQKIQQTVGGTLTGNKYLGYIDSKPPYNFSEGNDNLNSSPLPLATDLTVNNIKSNALLTEDSPFRSYEFTSLSSSECVLTEDKKWSRQSFYNPVYDAYDGDYMYDVYRNALIIFDHNIKPDSNYAEGENKPTETTPLTSRKRSIIQPLETGSESVKSFTKDMYGDGYVCIYNVIPDGDTLTFDSRKFNATTGKAEWGKNKQSKNYTYNTIKVQNVYADSLKTALDDATFNFTNDRVYLQPKQAIAEIVLPSSLVTGGEIFKYLTIPNEIALAENVKMQFKPFTADADNKANNYTLNFKLLTENNEEYLESSWVKVDPNAGKYTINLGKGLSNELGESTVLLTPEKPFGTIKFNVSESSAGGLTNNPFNISSDDSSLFINSYTSNLLIGTNGSISSENVYSVSYKETAEAFIKQYENENTKVNYLHRSTPIISSVKNDNGSHKADSAIMKFRIQPAVYCVSNSGTYNTVTIDKDEIVIDRTKLDASYFNRETDDEEFTKRVKKQTITKNELKPLWIPGKNSIFTVETPKGYDKKSNDGTNYLYVYNDIVAASDIYTQLDDSLLTVHKVTDETSLEITLAEDGLFNVKLGSLEKFGLVLKNPKNSSPYANLDEIKEDFQGTLIQDNTLIINTFLTNELSKTDEFILEASSFTEDGTAEVRIFTIPTEKYFDAFTLSDACLVSNTYGEVTSIELGYSETVVRSIVNGLQTQRTVETTDSLSIIDITNLEDGLIEKINDVYYIKPFVGDSGTSMKQLLYVNYKKGSEVIASSSLADEWISLIEVKDKSNWANLDNTSANKCYFKTQSGDTVILPYEFTINGEFYNVGNSIFETLMRENRYYVAKETDLNTYLDAWGFYYINEDASVCLKKLNDGETEQMWVNEQRNKILSSFPAIPSHASSVILECETKGSSTLTVYQVGNIDTDAVFVQPNLGGITSNIPNSKSLKSDTATWTSYKKLLASSGENIAYVEVPISIDEAGNKHFSIKVDNTGEILISIAGYKA